LGTLGKGILPLYGLARVSTEKEAKPLEEKKAIAFHHTTVQLLFMAQQEHVEKYSQQ
jgi:hypothetical protein